MNSPVEIGSIYEITIVSLTDDGKERYGVSFGRDTSDFDAEMQSIAPQCQAASNLGVGQLILSLSKDVDPPIWCRSRIVTEPTSAGTVYVEHIDYGCFEHVAIDQVALMPAKLKAYTPFAVLIECETTLELDGVYKVIVLKSLDDFNREYEVSLDLEKIPEIPRVSLETLNTPRSDELRPAIDLKGNEGLYVMESNGNYLSVQFGKYTEEELINLNENVDTFARISSKPGAFSFRKNDCVAVPVSDPETFYRGRICEIKENTAMVLQVDYGLISEVELSRLRALPDRFMDHPQVGFRLLLRADQQGLKDKESFTATSFVPVKNSHGFFDYNFELVDTVKETTPSVTYTEEPVSTPKAENQKGFDESNLQKQNGFVQNGNCTAEKPSQNSSDDVWEKESGVWPGETNTNKPEATNGFVKRPAELKVNNVRRELYNGQTIPSNDVEDLECQKIQIIPNGRKSARISTSSLITSPFTGREKASRKSFAMGHKEASFCSENSIDDLMFENAVEVHVTHTFSLTKYCVVDSNHDEEFASISEMIKDVDLVKCHDLKVSMLYLIEYEGIIQRCRLMSSDGMVFLVDTGEIRTHKSAFFNLPEVFSTDEIPSLSRIIQLYADDIPQRRAAKNYLSELPLKWVPSETFPDGTILGETCHIGYLGNSQGSLASQMIKEGYANKYPKALQESVIPQLGDDLENYFDSEVLSVIDKGTHSVVNLLSYDAKRRIDDALTILEEERLSVLLSAKKKEMALVKLLTHGDVPWKRGIVLGRPSPSCYKILLIDEGKEIMHPVLGTYRCPRRICYLPTPHFKVAVSTVPAPLEEQRVVVKTIEIQSKYDALPSVSIHDYENTLLASA